MKLMIMGYGRHGKDTMCEILKEKYVFTFGSSSYVAAKHVVFPVLRDLIGYQTVDECYADRHNHRALWYELIKAFNHNDPAALARLIFSEHRIYCGIRSIEEFRAAKEAGLFDYALWVDRSEVLPSETTNSCTVHTELADLVVNNNGDLGDLEYQVGQVIRVLTLCCEFDMRGW